MRRGRLKVRQWVRHGLAIGLVVAGIGTAGGNAALAQAIDCNRLAAQIASLGHGGDAGGRYQAAARKQQAELGRILAYARSLHCDQPNFLFFGNDRAPQCDGLNARIGQMQANLASLSQAAFGGGGARAALQQRFDAYCRGQNPGDNRNFFERLFNMDRPDRPGDVQPSIMEETPTPDDSQQAARGGAQAVCVRTCDGGYFPMTISARRGNLSELQDLCSALCPGTEAKLYTKVPGRELATAASADGEAYSDLPNAFRFEKAFDKTCSCKPANQNWAQALGNAEQLLGHDDRGDIVVTPEKSEELLRAVANVPTDPKKKKFDKNAIAKVLGKDSGKDSGTSLPADPAKAAIEQEKKSADEATARDAAAAAAAPTASGESSGIEKKDAKSQVIGKDEGTKTEAADPNGGRRKVRIIAPQL
jgi:hypothetical protein